MLSYEHRLEVFPQDPMLRINKVTEREGGLIEAFVPIDLIDQEEVAVDREHVEELAASIQKESSKQNTTGQLSPVLLAEVPGNPSFIILDGFHRVPAMASLGKKTVYSTIKPDATWEDVVDLRIVAAKSHKSVKFSRIIEWVEQSWSHSPWADKIGASSAFQMHFLNNSGARSGISETDAKGIREWVDQKCEQWGLSAPTIDRYLRTARLASPELVKEARDRTSGHKLEAITPRHLDAIVKFLPHKYDLQRVVADAATANALTIPEAKALSLAISREEDPAKIQRLIDTRVWERMASTSKTHTRKRYPEIVTGAPESYNSVLAQKFFDDQVSIAQLMIENAVLTGAYRPQDEDTPRVTTALMDSNTTPLDELDYLVTEDDAEIVQWDAERIGPISEKVISLNGVMSNILARKYSFGREDREDIVSTANMKFLIRVNDGRLPEEYSDDKHLVRLLAKFVENAAIDRLRAIKGRNGQKPQVLSYDHLSSGNEEGVLIKDKLVDTRAQVSVDEVVTSNIDRIRKLLPHLNERERRVVILQSYFELKQFEIAQVVGTTEATIAQTLVVIKRKAARLVEAGEIVID